MPGAFVHVGSGGRIRTDDLWVIAGNGRHLHVARYPLALRSLELYVASRSPTPPDVPACGHAVTPAGGNTLRGKVLSCCSPIALCYCRALLDGKTRYAGGNCDFAPKANNRQRSTHGSAIFAGSRATSTPSARPTSALTTLSSGAARRSGHLRPATRTTRVCVCSSAGGLRKRAASHHQETSSLEFGATFRRRDRRPRTSCAMQSTLPYLVRASSGDWLPNSVFDAAKSPRFTAVSSPNLPTGGRSQCTARAAGRASSQSRPRWRTQFAPPEMPGPSLDRSTGISRRGGSQNWRHAYCRRGGPSIHSAIDSPPPPTDMEGETSSESSRPSATARSRPLSATRPDHRTRSEQ